MTVFIVLTRPGSPAHTMSVPWSRLTEIMEEYRLLGWEVQQ
jgi:hypothetical protein